ncbi:MAG TPA: phosphohistidine phosphatase SixA [Thermoanaerobaculia bacterium]|jgi:phosphohistidine phosphatase|nr:phosphohistidine phosphatase SixA [Thermoanaerobaculia bacterium]
MEIWLLRHAAAEDRAPSGRDADRTLTEDGHRRARDVARGLAKLETSITLVLTSPYARARQTAEAAARALHLDGKIRETHALEPDADPADVLSEVRQEKADAVLLVGHEPHMGALLGRLVTGRGDVAIPMKKAAIARVVWDGSGAGDLRALLPAKVLEQIGE